VSGWHQLANLGYSRGFLVRPIDRWPGAETPDHARTWSQFSASLGSTLATLAKELRALDARNVALCIDLRERDIRLDGLPRADARPLTPRVLLAFDSKWGPLQYATDVYRSWEENLRAIALSMEALRAVDRYGVSKRGEQYRGWKALPASTDPAAALTTPEQATEFMRRWGGDFKRALRETHPDAGGDEGEFRTVVRARELIGAA
jgi:hypothetical protein